jgi:hypothetical protein
MNWTNALQLTLTVIAGWAFLAAAAYVVMVVANE